MSSGDSSGARRVHYVHHAGTVFDIGPHVFPVEKYELLLDWIRSDIGVDEARLHAAETPSTSDLERVHSSEYVDDLVHARCTVRTASSELPVEHDVIQVFVQMAGGAATTARLALEHGIGFHIGGGLHHAFADHAEGFCYVNDVAVGLARMRFEHRAARVLIVDVDVHQGNGTAAIFAADRDTFTYSIHQENNYPVKRSSDRDRGLADGVGDAEYLALLAEDLDAIDAHFTPDLVWYLAGMDPFEHDQLGGLSLTANGLVQRDELVLQRYCERGIPIAVSLAGGYARSPEETARLHLGTVRVVEAL